MPQLDMTTWPSQLFWLAVCFVTLYFIMSRVVVKRTGGIIALRKSTVEADLAAAQKLKAETDAAMASYEKAFADARSRAQSIAQENSARISAEIDTEMHKLDAALGEKTMAAEKRIAAARDKAMAHVSGIAEEIAANIVSELASVKTSAAAVKAAVAKVAK